MSVRFALGKRRQASHTHALLSAYSTLAVVKAAGRGRLGIAACEARSRMGAAKVATSFALRRLSPTACRGAELELNDCAHIDDAALYWLLGLRDLESLSLAGCVQVTDIGLCLLGSKLTALRRLDLGGCHEVRAGACGTWSCLDTPLLRQGWQGRLPWRMLSRAVHQ